MSIWIQFVRTVSSPEISTITLKKKKAFACLLFSSLLSKFMSSYLFLLQFFKTISRAHVITEILVDKYLNFVQRPRFRFSLPFWTVRIQVFMFKMYNSS